MFSSVVSGEETSIGSVFTLIAGIVVSSSVSNVVGTVSILLGVICSLSSKDNLLVPIKNPAFTLSSYPE